MIEKHYRNGNRILTAKGITAMAPFLRVCYGNYGGSSSIKSEFSAKIVSLVDSCLTRLLARDFIACFFRPHDRGCAAVMGTHLKILSLIMNKIDN
jgi:hypothetical protein